MSRRAALSDIRVLDLCDQKGAYCGKLLADMGADVILIEPPSGSPMRTIGPFHPSATTGDERQASLFFRHYNTSKRSVVVDLDSTAGRQTFLRLVRAADVVVESYDPGFLAARGIGYDALIDANPRIVLTSITPFGQSGPYRDLRGSDLIAQALGGLAYTNGAPDAEPLQGIGLQAYHSAATWAAIGCLLALLDRQRTGRGQWVDAGIHSCAAAALEHATSLYRETGTVAQRLGRMHWTRSFRTGRCRDGYVAHGIAGDWTALAEWVSADLDSSELSAARWGDAEYRRQNCDRLFATLDSWAADQDAEQLADAAQLRRLPYAALQPIETLPKHPQLRARNYFVPIEYETGSAALLHPGAPYNFSLTPWRIARRAPRLGEHNNELFDDAIGASAAPVGCPTSDRNGSLAGLRVVDFTWAVAGPLATRILADHGADVIKIENPNASSPRSLSSINLNRGKRSIAVDMRRPEGVALARSLILASDVVADNFSPRVMHNWGLDDDTLRRDHPQLISIGMSGFGASGPYRDRVSYGPTLQAAAGHSFLMPSGDEPTGWGFSYSDTVAGHTAALAILMALWFRRRTAEGQRIDLSQFESLVAVTGPALLAMQTMDVSAPGNGSQEGDAAPHGIFRCADEPEDYPATDRWCAIAVFGDDDWQRFARALGSPAWTGAQRFATLAGRQGHARELAAHVARWTAASKAEDIMQCLQAAGIAAGVVANAKDLCERDAQLRLRGYWISTRLPDGSIVELDGVPLLRSACIRPTSVPPAPQLGQDTDAILAEVLSFDTTTIAELRRTGVVA